MSAISKSASAFALTAVLAAGPVLAGPWSCMPMGAGPADCSRQAAAQDNGPACPTPAEKNARECAGNGQDMGGTMASMAAGGMGIAMTVIGAIFGAPTR